MVARKLGESCQIFNSLCEQLFLTLFPHVVVYHVCCLIKLFNGPATQITVLLFHIRKSLFTRQDTSGSNENKNNIKLTDDRNRHSYTYLP